MAICSQTNVKGGTSRSASFASTPTKADARSAVKVCVIAMIRRFNRAALRCSSPATGAGKRGGRLSPIWDRRVVAGAVVLTCGRPRFMSVGAIVVGRVCQVNAAMMASRKASHVQGTGDLRVGSPTGLPWPGDKVGVNAHGCNGGRGGVCITALEARTDGSG
jgi:hypothetical protein